MLALLSPAKRLDVETPPRLHRFTQPRFLDEAKDLAARGAEMKAETLRGLMDISEDLADKTARRFQSFAPPFDLSNAKQAILAFKGDVYRGFDADSLNEDDLAAAQERVRILSGLYGLLRPLDLMQAYRLEMGARLQTPKAADLYGYWGDKIARAIADDLAGHSDPTVVNLASREYFKAVDKDALGAPVVTCEFREVRQGRARIIALYAKQARGRMARFIAVNRIDKAVDVQQFDLDGYRFRDDLSNESDWVFTRPDSRG